jgi:hypothetical protein
MKKDKPSNYLKGVVKKDRLTKFLNLGNPWGNVNSVVERIALSANRYLFNVLTDDGFTCIFKKKEELNPSDSVQELTKFFPVDLKKLADCRTPLIPIFKKYIECFISEIYSELNLTPKKNNSTSPIVFVKWRGHDLGQNICIDTNTFRVSYDCETYSKGILLFEISFLKNK